MTTKNHVLYNAASLDAIIENMLDNMQESTPFFLMNNEKNIEKEIEEYTKQVIRQCQPGNNHNVIPIVENHAGKLLDSICESNRIYFETGIKVGAVLLLQLIDL